MTQSCAHKTSLAEPKKKKNRPNQPLETTNKVKLNIIIAYYKCMYVRSGQVRNYSCPSTRLG